MRPESQTGQTAELLAAMFAAVTPAEGPSLGDRMSNPARVASRRGSSCRIAGYDIVSGGLLPANRINSPRLTFVAARRLGAPTRAATAWP
jgi:hypothetical protein